MIRALVCGPETLGDEFQGTLLGRGDVELHFAPGIEAARVLAAAVLPQLVVVDRDLSSSDKIVSELRKEGATRSCSIVIVARGDFDVQDAVLLEAGANAVLRLPAHADWDIRLNRLMSVPGRRDVRVSVRIAGSFLDDTVPAVGLNLSLHGMLVEVDRRIQVGDEIGLRFELPENGPPIVGNARVVRRAGASKVGLEFLELEGDSDRNLQQFLTVEGGL